MSEKYVPRFNLVDQITNTIESIRSKFRNYDVVNRKILSVLFDWLTEAPIDNLILIKKERFIKVSVKDCNIDFSLFVNYEEDIVLSGKNYSKVIFVKKKTKPLYSESISLTEDFSSRIIKPNTGIHTYPQYFAPSKDVLLSEVYEYLRICEKEMKQHN